MNSSLRVSADGTHLTRDGEPLPLVVDTAWNAFSAATEDEWIHYLDTRRRQGFTATAISILPILHDRAAGALRTPFPVRADGGFDLSDPQESYFATARRFVELAVERGLVPLLVVLWCNYVPDSWGARRGPGGVMDPDQRRRYVSLVCEVFAPYGPLLAVSGDDDFVEPASVEAYVDAARQLRREAPSSLLTAHSTPTAVLPAELGEELDFFVYQSGHDPQELELTWELAAPYRSLTPRRPVLNLEPPYEQHGYAGQGGRFDRDGVRRAAWWSVLGGASSGVGYGAHGVWQWYREGQEFNGVGFSNRPFPWARALEFPGARDLGLLGDLISRHRLYRLEPAQEIISAEQPIGTGVISPFVRAARSADGALVVVYLPYATSLALELDLGAFEVVAWDLAERAPIAPRVRYAAGATRIGQVDVLADALVIFERAGGA